ncbi:hypothetical protein SDC9_180102 [bioreactor metagenome]|uniref:4-hydroxy-2-oxoglutarate aldolase n=1 Tax=bioreactor metagenome TaxID=1076179 RepID=A0A645H2T8_9ZZZZ
MGGVVVNPGDIIAADSDGVAVIRPNKAEEILAGCRQIAQTEIDKDAEVVQLRAARQPRQ